MEVEALKKAREQGTPAVGYHRKSANDVEKLCRTCLIVKPLAAFFKGTAKCKQCYKLYWDEYKKKNPEFIARKNEYQRNWYKENKLRHRDWFLQKRYGITLSEFDELIQKTDGKCEICKRVLDDPCLDHDHNTGKIRGVLCSTCNSGLGMFQDNVEYLAEAREYLVKHLAPESNDALV